MNVRVSAIGALYEKLDWDSIFFQFPVVKILPDKITFLQLQSILNELRDKKVKLVYWASHPDDRASQESAQKMGGVLVDRKITYLLDLQKISLQNLSATRIKLEEYLERTLDPGLEKLALQSGEYSRFRVDPRIGMEKCKDLYKLWMVNSVNRTAADAILVVRNQGQIVGVVTMGEKNGRGNIGLICVDQSIRGKGLGTDLLKAAHRWFFAKGYSAVQAITQGANTGATRFYEKSGYTVEKIENFYHFWL